MWCSKQQKDMSCLNVSFSKIGKEIIRKEMDKVKSITSLNIDVFSSSSSSEFEKKEEGIICIAGDEMYNLTD